MPFVRWCYSWEPLIDHGENYQAITYHHYCPNCGRQPIEIYADKLIDEWVWEVFFGDGEVFGLLQTINVINQRVTHELCHWAGCDEEAALESEAISFEETCDELNLSPVLKTAEGVEGILAEQRDLIARPLAG